MLDAADVLCGNRREAGVRDIFGKHFRTIDACAGGRLGRRMAAPGRVRRTRVTARAEQGAADREQLVPAPARRAHRRRVGPGQPLRIRPRLPSLATVVRLAEAFGVSTDYLLVDDAPRRPFRSAEDVLGDQLATVAELSDDDRALLLSFLDALVTRTASSASPPASALPSATAGQPPGAQAGPAAPQRRSGKPRMVPGRSPSTGTYRLRCRFRSHG
jgi:hypothetical protein